MNIEKQIENQHVTPNEIELKVMLSPENIPFIQDWLETLTPFSHAIETLENTYYDSSTFYFEQHQMGLRVRTKNNTHQLTLKTKGDILGGLHIRPEYNLSLEDNRPDFKRLVHHYNLSFPDDTIINAPLFATFSTDFTRHKRQINYRQSQIEIALDQGIIKNQYGQDNICEIEFELKTGNLCDLFSLLEEMPKKSGMWLSSLSKAQRGYFIGNNEKIANEIAILTACDNNTPLTEIAQFQLSQYIADFIRLTQDNRLIARYQQLTATTLKNSDELIQPAYLTQSLHKMKSFYLL